MATGKFPQRHPDDYLLVYVFIGHQAVEDPVPINELLYRLEDNHQASNYQEVKELSGDFTQVGDTKWERSEVQEVTEGDNTFVKARAVWYD